jgi:hypothetical protein
MSDERTQTIELIDQINAKQAELQAELADVARKHNKSAARRARKITLELDTLHKRFRKVSTHI